MNKKRLALMFSILLLLATLVIIATVFAIKYHQQPKPVPIPAPLPPIEAPKVEPPIVPPPEPKEVKKPKVPIKPPKIIPPVVTLDDDVPGKVRLCPGNRATATIESDGRLLGHRPYADAAAGSLGSSPSGFNSGSCSQLHSEAKAALEQMITAARATDPALADAMIGLSCFRSAKYQREVFCRKVSDGFAVRARASAPPGYSEHATGYALDFGDRNNPQCNLSACFATTPVGEWLSANAAQHGFVLSFPAGNAQGVMYEPWHWRYSGSPAAQTVFTGAN
jgi:zinc D-Ala-D-Ala carboxypeptidase